MLILATLDSFYHRTWAQFLHDDDYCLDGSELAVLDFFTDSNSDQNGWSLICEGNEFVWDVPVGTFKKKSGSRFTESSCIPKTESCSLTFVDSGGDGLTGEGFLTFRYGVTTLALVNYGETVSFSKLLACFGPSCNQTTLEVVGANDNHAAPKTKGVDDNQEAPGEIEAKENRESPVVSDVDDEKMKNDGIFCLDNEKNVALDILLDENPKETGWSLVCDGELYWAVATGMSLGKGGNWINQNICVPKIKTCTFILTDTTGDGLSPKGYYALRHGATTVAASKYGSATPFSQKVFCFGPDCVQLSLEQIQHETDASNMNTETTFTGPQTTESDRHDPVAIQDEDETTASADDATESHETEPRDNSTIIVAVLGGALSFVCIILSCLLFLLRHQKKSSHDLGTQRYDKEKQLRDNEYGGSQVSDAGESGLLLHVLHGYSSADSSMCSEDQ